MVVSEPNSKSEFQGKYESTAPIADIFCTWLWLPTSEQSREWIRIRPVKSISATLTTDLAKTPRHYLILDKAFLFRS